METFTNIPEAGSLIFATFADLPASAADGTLATTADTGLVYVFTSGSWQLRGAGSGAGILDINGETGTSQTLAVGSAGTDFAVVSGTDTHTFNLPVADATHTGKLSSTDWSTFNNKLSAVPYPLLAPDGTSLSPSYGFTSEPGQDTGMFRPGTSALAWSVNGVQTMTLTGGDLDITGNFSAANYPPVGSINTFAGFDIAGDLQSVPGFSIDSISGGQQVSLTEQPNNAGGGFNVNSVSVNFDPQQNSPNDSWNIFSNQVFLDVNSSGFTQGTSGTAINMMNMGMTHQGTGDTGALYGISQNFNIGNGTDPITVGGLAYCFGFGAVNANVTVTGTVQGYGFQPNFNAASVLSNSVNAFYDFSNFPIAVDGYNSFIANPNIGSINSNRSYVAFNSAPNIDSLSSNASYIGVAISPIIDAFGNQAGLTGVNINPTATGSHSAYGINVSMDNVTSYAGAVSSLVEQDLTLTFNNAGDNNTITLEYVNDATAGSETASFVVPNIVVHIQSGVSTATQVKAALDANFTIVSNITTTISGVASNPQVTTGPVNFSGGEAVGVKKAAYLDGDVEITGSLAFGGALSIGQLNAFASQALADGGGSPASVHMLITNPTVADNVTVANADLLGVNTAALINIGDNATVTTAFLGVAALGLPAVLTMGTGSTIDKISGAAFALSMDAGSTGGTVDEVSLCRSIAIPNGITTVNKLFGFKFDLPFGDPGTETWGFYATPDAFNWLKGSLKIGGTAGSTDKAGVGNKFEMEGGAFALASDVDVGFYGTSPIAQPVSSGPATAGGTYTATEQAMLQEVYDAIRALGLMS